MLTAKSAADWFADRSNADCIAHFVDLQSARSRLADRDIILSTRGTVGMCALVTIEALPANIDQDVARISWRQECAFEPEFVVAYLNSRYGQDHMIRYASGSVQQGLPLETVREIPIPEIDQKTQKGVKQLVLFALSKRRQARAELAKAEETFLAALRLRDWRPPTPLAYTRRASEAFLARRLDAQYFAPRVRELLAHLDVGGRKLRDIATVRREKFVPAREGSFDYIEIGDIHTDGTAGRIRLAQSDAPSRATQFVRANDVITSTVRPLRRLSALIFPDQAGSVCSSGFLVLDPQGTAPEVLLTYLRLPVVCELMDLHTSASLYPAISEADILRLPFPELANEAVGKQIVAAVQGAHATRQHARYLLAAAQRTVEIAIEQSEAAALESLQAIPSFA